MTPIAKRLASAVGACALSVMMAACTVSVGGAGAHGSSSQSGGASTSAPNPDELLQQHCAQVLTSAAGFLESWTALATDGSIPTAEQRSALADEIQGYIDQLDDQLPQLVDATLTQATQALIAEMGTLVQGLHEGIEVKLDSYQVAVEAVKSHCDS